METINNSTDQGSLTVTVSSTESDESLSQCKRSPKILKLKLKSKPKVTWKDGIMDNEKLCRKVSKSK
jgi:hypothetical protein